jgi:outer membrane protein
MKTNNQFNDTGGLMKTIILAILSFCFLLPNTAGGAELKVGYVDFNKALNESDKGKQATAILEDVIKNKKSILEDQEAEIKAIDEELKKQATILSPESRKDKEDSLKKLIRDAQRMRRDFQEEIQKKEADLTQEIQNDLMKIVNSISKEKGYAIVFERGVSGILYFQNKYDITDTVINEYNKSIKQKE